MIFCYIYNRGIKIERFQIKSLHRLIIDLLLGGYEAHGVSWYLGDAGDSCDTTCSNLMLSNNAVAAMSAVDSGDCSVLQHLISANNLGSSITTLALTSYWTFGHFYTNSQYYYCTNYGSGNAAVNVGQTNVYSTRRLVCSCLGIQ